MSDSAKELLALFDKLNTNELDSNDYICIENNEQAIIELENDGLIVSKNNICGTIIKI